MVNATAAPAESFFHYNASEHTSNLSIPTSLENASALSAAEIESCERVLQSWWATARSKQAKISRWDTPLLVTYATALPSEWLLGLSAALHGMPLILVGHGQPWVGLHQKFFGTKRATTLLEAHADLSRLPLLFADAWDAMLLNPPDAPGPLNDLSHGPPRVILSSECNSFPECYHSALAREPAMAACQADPARTCYINSGAYGASSAMVASSLLSAVIRQLSDTSHLYEAERFHDQAAMVHLYLRRLEASAAGTLRSNLTIDSFSELFLSLYACSG
eukprot:CAMPEP_0181178034 /NCGR_PEP_ID=MMETSP1096-20121128/5500_1 /TAXON_ID=156174 ORGANISM="Chrysochromulina ericina, Strain CCMP281" /NCGR_SAMPLE_ID=MMETSP1096 /ASSEMBLY_ACC=CAM_ASM_000453 /LENGTH=276 /DNA_ID=CAMNT_0023266267 /DNA_START=79 /DNA_END=905 /DNA_ORIENTATION=+